MSTAPDQPPPNPPPPPPPTPVSPPSGTIINCGCKHKPPPHGTNTTCPYSPGVSCGGVATCAICRGEETPV